MISRMRLDCAALAGWLFVLFNIERMHQPMNVASFVYVLAALVAVAIVGIPLIGRMRLQWVVFVPLSVYLVLKIYLGYSLFGQSLPITVMEVCAITLTATIAFQIADRARRLESLTAGIIGNPDRQPVPMETAQSVMYREVRRARQHRRPLSVVTVQSTTPQTQMAPDQVLQELQKDLVSKFTSARISELLANEAKDHAIISQTKNNFVVMLPETDRDTADQMVRQMYLAIKSALGLKLQFGVSTFPDEEVTLVGLMERAESNMRDQDSSDSRASERISGPSTRSAEPARPATPALVTAPADETASPEYHRFGQSSGADGDGLERFASSVSQSGNSSP